tara:strand:+ start:217 stop:714 length:498 start_codon:yes stop_codon:yes gene_type:complete
MAYNNKNYNKMPYQKPYINNHINKAGGIIVSPHLNKVLCVMNKYTFEGGEYKWGLPKGHMENNESISKCARREILEETGMDFRIKDFKYYYKMRNVRMYLFHIYKYKQLKINDKSEIALLEWYTIDELKELNSNREIKYLLIAIDNTKTKTLEEFYYKTKKLNKY